MFLIDISQTHGSLKLKQALETFSLPSILPKAERYAACTPPTRRRAVQEPVAPRLRHQSALPAAAVSPACESGSFSFSSCRPCGNCCRSGPEIRSVTGSATCRCWLSVSGGRGGLIGPRVKVPGDPVAGGAQWAGGGRGTASWKPISALPGCRGDFPAQPSSKVSYRSADKTECPLGTLVFALKPGHVGGGFQWGVRTLVWGT